MNHDPSRFVDPDLADRLRLEQRLLARGRARAAQARGVIALEHGPRMPVTAAQRGIWFTHQVAAAPETMNVVQAERLKGALDAAALGRAIAALVARQRTLATCYVPVDGLPVAVAAGRAPGLVVEDRTAIPPGQRDEAAQELVDAGAAVPFDLAAEAPMRATLYRFDAEDHLLLLVLHHIACDEWSVRVLRSELATLYASQLRGAAPALSPLRVQYADFAAWQNGQLDAGHMDPALDYWAGRLDGAGSGDTIPATVPARRAARGMTGTVTLAPEPGLLRAADALGRRQDATPFMTMLALVMAWLHLRTGCDDLAIATQTAGRGRPETADLVGVFTTTIVIRTRLSPETGFAALLDEVRDQVIAGLGTQSVPFDAVVRRVRPERQDDAVPFSRLMFTHRYAFEGSMLAADLDATQIEPRSEAAKFDLWVSILDRTDGVEGREIRLIHDTARHTDAAATEMAGQIAALLAMVVADPARPLISLGATGPAPAADPAHPARATVDFAADPGATGARVAAIWREVLRRDEIGPDDSFFDVGGDSLLIMQLVHRIETGMGVSLPIADAFRRPTVRAMARCIDTLAGAPEAPRPDGPADPLIVPLTEAPAIAAPRPRYYVVSGAGGHVLPFAPAAVHLRGHRQGIGLLEPALAPGEPSQGSLEAVAARMIRSLRASDPAGPYFLVGYSYGGRVVHEMASQLSHDGASVGVVILDTVMPARSIRGTARGAVRTGRDLLAQKLGVVGLRRLSRPVPEADSDAERLYDPVTAEERALRASVAMRQRQLLSRYRAPVTTTPLVLIRATGSGTARAGDDMGWSAIARVIDVMDTPGDHLTLFKGANTVPFAGALDRALTLLERTLGTGGA